jgi:hypothetical protein
MVRKIADEPYTPPKEQADSEKPADSLTDKIRTLLDQ